MIRTQEVRKEQNNFFKKHENPRPLNFFIEFKYRRKSSGCHDYKQQLDKALQDDPNSKKLLDLRRKYDDNYKNDWAQYEDWKKDKKVNDAVKKRKREAHARFHAQLDDNLDGGNFFGSRKRNKEVSSNNNIDKEDVNNYESEEEEIIRNDNETRITDVLENVVECSEAMKTICSVYMEQHPDGDLIDLRSCSPFFKKLPKLVADSYLLGLDEITESLIPMNVHDFLVQFFSQNISDTEWQIKVDDLRPPKRNDPLMTAVVRILHRTLPQFIKAFSHGAQNPLQNIATIEQAHLNAFVHPCLDAALWYLAKIRYEYGEIPSRNHINKNRADGVGFMSNADKFQLVYVEGSGPMVEKEVTDIKKITNNLKNIFSKIVKETVKNRRRLPKKLAVFGGQSSRLRIYLYYLDYCGKYRLNEVDNANLPRDFSEMPDFVYFYECVLKWALLVQAVTTSFSEARTEKRPSRLSYANSHRLDE